MKVEINGKLFPVHITQCPKCRGAGEATIVDRYSTPEDLENGDLSGSCRLCLESGRVILIDWIGLLLEILE